MPMKQKRVTLRVIAEETGVSLNTVSLALRGSPRLADKTKERVQRAAKELGYQPNPVLAAGMAQLRTRQETESGAVIACIHFLSWTEITRWAGHRHILIGMEQRAEELGYRLEKFHLESGVASQRQIRNRMRNTGMPGALVIGPSSPDIEGQLLRIVEQYPVVKAGGELSTLPLHFTESDHFAGTRLAVEKAVKMGAARPGLVINQGYDDLIGRRISGAYWAEVGRLPRGQRIEPLLLPVVQKDGTLLEMPEAVRAWARKWRPDALITNQKNASRADWRAWLGSTRDIQLIQLGHHIEETQDWPGITFPGRENGRAAVDLLVAMIHRGEHGIPPFQKCSMVEGSWVEGA